MVKKTRFWVLSASLNQNTSKSQFSNPRKWPPFDEFDTLRHLSVSSLGGPKEAQGSQELSCWEFLTSLRSWDHEIWILLVFGCFHYLTLKWCRHWRSVSEDFGGSRVGMGLLGAQKTDLEQSDVPKLPSTWTAEFPPPTDFHHVTKWHPSPGGWEMPGLHGISWVNHWACAVFSTSSKVTSCKCWLSASHDGVAVANNNAAKIAVSGSLSRW